MRIALIILIGLLVAPAPVRSAPQREPLPPLDVAAQSAALLPAHTGDLAGASAWDRYTMRVALDPHRLSITGQVRLDYVNLTGAPLGDIGLHLYPNHPDFGGSLSVRDVTVNGRPAPTMLSADRVLLRVGLTGLPNAVLEAGAVARIELSFTARTSRNRSASAYGAFNSEAGVWNMATFYPVAALRLGDDWDPGPLSSRGDLAVTRTGLYDVRIDAPTSVHLVATGVPVETERGGGRQQVRFVSGPQRDFFLAALSGLEQASAQAGGTRVVSYYQRGDRAGGQRALTAAVQALELFNQRAGAYPLAEIEIVQAALTSFIGVEYPGVVLIEQSLYRSRGTGLEITVAHEVAHQWWYSLVGSDPQREPWIDEGLASYAQVLYAEAALGPRAAATELEALEATYRRARQDGRDASLLAPTSAFRGTYVALVYGKSALFFHALRQQIGDAAFDRFLQTLTSRHKYGLASSDDVLAAAEAGCTCELDPLYDTWVRNIR